MRSFTMSKSAVLVKSKPRLIVHRTRGQRHGAITRLMSPGDLGQVLKPFVFLDLFDTAGNPLSGLPVPPPLRPSTGAHTHQSNVTDVRPNQPSSGLTPSRGET